MTEDNKRILIIDAKASRRDQLASRFRLQGFYVELSNSGMQALSVCEKELYDTLVIIGNTADLPAHELISLLRNLYKKNELQIIFSDKTSNQEDVIHYFGLGINDFIVYNDKIFGSLLEKITAFKPAATRTTNHSALKSLDKDS